MVVGSLGHENLVVRVDLFDLLDLTRFTQPIVRQIPKVKDWAELLKEAQWHLTGS